MIQVAGKSDLVSPVCFNIHKSYSRRLFCLPQLRWISCDSNSRRLALLKISFSSTAELSDFSKSFDLADNGMICCSIEYKMFLLEKLILQPYLNWWWQQKLMQGHFTVGLLIGIIRQQ